MSGARGSDIGVDGSVLLLTVSVSLAIGCLLGLLSYWRVSSTPDAALTGGNDRFPTGDRRTRLAGHGLATIQVAAAFVLLVGALLMLISLDRILAIDPGFETERILTASLSLPRVRYPTADHRRAFADRTVDRLARVPGVTAVGLGSAVPFAYCCPTSSIYVEGVADADQSHVAPYLVMANGGYFAALGIELVEGRVFDHRDTATSRPESHACDTSFRPNLSVVLVIVLVIPC